MENDVLQVCWTICTYKGRIHGMPVCWTDQSRGAGTLRKDRICVVEFLTTYSAVKGS